MQWHASLFSPGSVRILDLYYSHCIKQCLPEYEPCSGATSKSLSERLLEKAEIMLVIAMDMNYHTHLPDYENL